MAEASSVIARETRPVGADPIPAQLRGLLAQDNRGFYSPTIANTTSNFADSTDATIDAIALQAPTPWPEMDTPGKLAAYAYISQQLLDLPGCDGPIPCDVRATYDDILTKGTFDPSKVTFPTDQTNFKNFDFSAVQRQLSKEAKYSQYVLNLYGALDSFYSNQQATINAILTSAYQKVSNSLHPPSDASSTPNWELVFSIGLDIVNDASGIAGGPPLQAAVDAFSIATTLAAKFSNTTTGDPRKNLSVTFANLLDRSLADASEHSKVLDNTFNLILTDWGRLETLGQQIQTTEITWTGDIETAAKTSFTIAASQHYYTQLTKSVYQIAWFEDLREGSQPAPRDWCDWTVQQADCPVSRSLAIGSWAALATGPSGGSGDGLKYDFLILTRNTSPCDSTSNWAPGSVTNNIVAPLTPGDTTTMGLWKPYFYRYGGFDLKFNPGYGCSGFNNRCEWCEF